MRYLVRYFVHIYWLWQFLDIKDVRLLRFCKNHLQFERSTNRFWHTSVICIWLAAETRCITGQILNENSRLLFRTRVTSWNRKKVYIYFIYMYYTLPNIPLFGIKADCCVRSDWWSSPSKQWPFLFQTRDVHFYQNDIVWVWSVITVFNWKKVWTM